MEGNYWVYTHTCPNGMVYVGYSSAKNTYDRWGVCAYKSTSLQPYIEEFGWDNIEHFFIDGIQTKESAMKLEDDLIQMYRGMGCCINKENSVGWRDEKQIKEYWKEHKKERDKRYYNNHREELKKRKKEYHKEHIEEHKKYMKEYNDNHKEERKEKAKQYYKEHKEKIKEYKKKYNEEHKEELKRKRREYYLKHKKDNRNFEKL